MNPHAEDMFLIRQKDTPCLQCHGNVKESASQGKGSPHRHAEVPLGDGKGEDRHDGSLAPRVSPLSRPTGRRQALGGNRALTPGVFLRDSPWNLLVSGRFL